MFIGGSIGVTTAPPDTDVAIGATLSCAGTPICAENVAVYAVSVAAVVMLCVMAPPSDLDTNVHGVVVSVCGDVAPMLRMIPATPSTVYGVVTG